MTNTLKTTTLPECRECGDAIEYSTRWYRWQHFGESRESLIGPSEGWRGHSASPVQKCADCGGPITSRQDAWADYQECTTCRTEFRHGLGD